MQYLASDLPGSSFFRLDFEDRWSGTVVVTCGQDWQRFRPGWLSTGLRVVQGHAFRVVSNGEPPDGRNKQSKFEFISEACKPVGT